MCPEDLALRWHREAYGAALQRDRSVRPAGHGTRPLIAAEVVGEPVIEVQAARARGESADESSGCEQRRGREDRCHETTVTHIRRAATAARRMSERVGRRV